MIGLIITIYKRPEYLKRCFDSLQAADLSQVGCILLINDDSKDKEINQLYYNFQHKDCITLRWKNSINQGIKKNLLLGVDMCKSMNYTTIINLDSDMIVKPNFINRLTLLKGMFPENIVSGINCTQKNKDGQERNPLISEYEDYYLKKHVGGACLCFTYNQFKNIIRPSLLKGGNWDYNTSLLSEEKNQPIVVTKPSVAQHIGMKSSMGHHGEEPDQAFDFDEKLYLPNVTLFGIDAFNPQGIERASEISQRGIVFGAVRVITQRLFPGSTLEEGRSNYSKFMIKSLTTYFTTSHILTIHSDGYVVNPNAWNNEWLQYDYIGATWGYKDNMNVGNGGFSLRSKKLCDILAIDNTINDFHPEDDKICRKYRKYLEDKYDIKFAPEEVANKFSIEAYGAKVFPKGNHYSGQFGFHSSYVDFSSSQIPQAIRL